MDGGMILLPPSFWNPSPCIEGSLRIVEVPRNLRRPVPNEKKLMSSFLERESSRVTDMLARGPMRAAAIKGAEEGKKAKVRGGGREGGGG